MNRELQEKVLRYSKLNGYPITEFAEVVCVCGNSTFLLSSDDEEGGAVLNCPNCYLEIDLESSKEYINEPQRNICSCYQERLAIGVGKALYPSSSDVRWVYIGAHCPECRLNGVYVDWKQP